MDLKGLTHNHIQYIVSPALLGAVFPFILTERDYV